LVIARLWQPPRHGEYERHGMLRYRALVHTLCAREPHASAAQEIAVELIGAGTNRLDEPKFRRALKKLVSPEPGDNQYIRLAHAIR
jgi:hypothetical protein